MEKEAVREFVNTMDFIPITVVEKLYLHDESVTEVTPPALGNSVWYHPSEGGESQMADIIETLSSGFKELYKIRTYDNEERVASSSEIDVITEDVFPIWGTLFVPDLYYQRTMENNEDNIMQKIADIGFRIYESEDFGYMLGIDSAGFDFYPAYWEPLYNLFFNIK